MRTLIASDWHLGSQSPAVHARLACTFLQQARVCGDRVVLNGDIFEGVFEPIETAEAAHPQVMQLLDDLRGAGKLLRIAGNHDPTRGEPEVVLDFPVIGRVLVAHGHAADPWQSSVGGAGDRLAQRYGHSAAWRKMANLVEHVVMGTVSKQVQWVFAQRCLRLVERARCQLGVFGHVHHQFLSPPSRYANGGSMWRERLEYLRFEGSRVTKAVLRG